jgi:hypothetical protein
MNGPMDTLLGIGLGRFPASCGVGARYGARATRLAVRPRLELVLHGRGRERPVHVCLAAREPDPGWHRRRRTPIRRAVRSRSASRARLLHGDRCKLGEALVEPTGGWQRVTIPLHSPPVPAADGRRATFSLHLPDPGSIAEIRSLSLTRDGDINALRNADFQDGLALVSGRARRLLPWHIDSLPLEVLIERSVLGWPRSASRRLRSAARGPESRIDGGAVSGSVAARRIARRLVSSVLDAPRIAFLLLYLIAVSLASSEHQPVPKT